MDDKPTQVGEDWINARMGKSSQETARRLLSTEQPPTHSGAPVLTLRSVRSRCVAGGSSNFWIIGSDAAEPVLSGEFPLIGMSPTAYFVRVAQFNNLPYAVQRAELTSDNHSIAGDISALESDMKEAYG